MNRKFSIFIILGFLVIILIWYIVSNFIGNRVDNQTAAYVNGEFISNKEVIHEVDRMKKFYTYSNQDLENYSSLEKDMLERLIEEKLILQYAQKSAITVEENEIKNRYEAAVKREGDEKNLLEKLDNMYNIGKSEYLAKVSMDILREKVQEDVEVPLEEWLKKEKKSANIKANPPLSP